MTLNITKGVLHLGKTALLLCDMQSVFGKHIYCFDKIVENSTRLIAASKVLQVPMLVTEQAPSKLGRTVPELDISGALGPFEKTQCSMYTPEVSKELSKICSGQRPQSILLFGIAAHICVENTAIDLKRNGFDVHIIADCTSSRTQEDRMLAFERMKQIGCTICTYETVIYRLIKGACHPKFKDIQKLLENTTVQTGLAPLSNL